MEPPTGRLPADRHRRRPSGSFPTSLTASAGRAFFTADGGNGAELWGTDGTASGTHRVRHRPRRRTAAPTGLVDVAGTLFFAATDADHGDELCRATAARTAQAGAYQRGAWRIRFRITDGRRRRLFFTADDSGATSLDERRSETTQRVADIAPGATDRRSG
jgi:ELWxxDGT repeat protein